MATWPPAFDQVELPSSASPARQLVRDLGVCIRRTVWSTVASRTSF